MPKARKPSAETTVRKRKSSHKPRAVALAVEEARVSVPRKSRKATKASRPPREGVPAPLPGSAQILQLMWQWSPWNIMLRQQAALASMMSKMMRAKD